MGFNYAKEKKQFDETWKKLQREYEDAGMVPQDIESVRIYDWEMFLSRRTYENHTQQLPDAFLTSAEEDTRSTLFQKFISLSATFDEEDFSGRYAWVETISSAEIVSKLKLLSVKDLELLTLYAIEGRSQAEIAQIQGRDQSVISRKIKRIKIFLKK